MQAVQLPFELHGMLLSDEQLHQLRLAGVRTERDFFTESLALRHVCITSRRVASGFCLLYGLMSVRRPPFATDGVHSPAGFARDLWPLRACASLAVRVAAESMWTPPDG